MAASVTVVMPAHNTEKLIGGAIQSVLDQTFTDFELWVLENGSTDKTSEVARSYASDSRVQVFELGKIGFQGALECALEYAKTEYIARMDSDDVVFPNRLERQMRFLNKHPEYAMVGTQYALMTPFGHIFERADMDSQEITIESMLLRPWLNGRQRRFFADSSVIFHREFAKSVGGYDPEFTMGDVPLWLRILLGGGRGWQLAETLYVQLLRSNSLSKTHSEGMPVRMKYLPQFAPDSTGNKKNTIVNPREAYWIRIASLEMIAGDWNNTLKLIDRISDSNLIRYANRLRLYARLGRLGVTIYRWRLRHTYRHRPDWESLFPYLNDSFEDQP